MSSQGSSHITFMNDIRGLLQDEIIRYSNEGFIIMTGDFNARIQGQLYVGEELDYMHHDSADYVKLFSSYPLSRRTEDMVVNGYGKNLLNSYNHVYLAICELLMEGLELISTRVHLHALLGEVAALLIKHLSRLAFSM